MKGNRASKGITVNTKQDLAPLTMKELTKLREKADQLGLSEFRARIDAQLVILKQATGSLSERDALYISMGVVPGALPRKSTHSMWVHGEFLVEIPEGEFLPGRVPGSWVWQKSGAQATEERQEIQREHDDLAMDSWYDLREGLERCGSTSALVVPILYNPAKGGKKYRPVPGVKGEVESVNRKTGAFKIVFTTRREQ